MCGIAGYYSLKEQFTPDDLKIMTDSIQHRGPDAEGHYQDNVCGLGHRRLSIIDLSDRANQPMFSSNGRYVVIYNGEVYNFSEIGARLKSAIGSDQSINFKTSSDTEIILEAFVHFGIDFVHLLNGMFAIAIYDTKLQELHLFRDRLGIKPLIYYWDGQTFIFASEIKAITALKKLKLTVRQSAIREFLHFGFIPTPGTIYNEVFKMNSGSRIKISAQGLEESPYWSIRNVISNKVIRDKEQALVKLSDILISSVQYQLKSDVPFGVFLSGGIDSSLVSAQAVGLSSVQVNTFSIGFEENSHNESEYAKAVARYLGTSHHEFIVSYKDAVDLIDTVFDIYDEPYADSSAIPTLLVSKLARQYVTVTLSGEGGDELFLGYGAYQWARRLNNPAFNFARPALRYAFSKMTPRYQRIAKMLSYNSDVSLPTHIFSQEQYFFSEEEINNLLKDNSGSLFVSTHLQERKLLALSSDPDVPAAMQVKERVLNAMERQSLFDLQYYLQDDLLTKVDRASMSYGLETRVPYLDHRLVELVLNIDPALKFKNGISKYILKEILYQYVPKELFQRPKQGFAIPMNKWLRHELNYLIQEYLSKEIIEKAGIIRYEIVEQLKQQFAAGTDYLYNRLWLLIVLHRWIVKHNF